MKMRLLVLIAFIVCMAVNVASAAPVSTAAAQSFTSSFQKPPSASLKALKAAVGRPFSSGFVFVDGHYIPPPYRVERYGTVIRINGVQVSGEIVPWDEFIKTQAGVKAIRTESAPEPEPEAAVAEPEPEEDSAEDDEFDVSDLTLDDLFSDNPMPKKPAKKRTTRVAKPAPKKPTVKVTYEFDGEFKPNTKTQGYLKRINDKRTRIDMHLRNGGFCCFGSRYNELDGESMQAKTLLSKLPEAMKNCTSYETFYSRMAAGGFSYFPQTLIADFYSHRFDYPQLLQRRRAIAEEQRLMHIGSEY